MLRDIFSAVFNLSVTASYIIAVVFLVRLIFAKRMPKLFSYALWGIVLLRLVMPFSLPSEVSVLNLFTANVPAPMSASIVVPPIDDLPRNTQINIDGSITTVIPSGQPGPAEFWFNLVAIIWIIGAAVLFLLYILSYILIARKLKTATLYKNNIFLSDKVKSPIVFGFMKPRIYLPSDIESICSDTETEHIIAHEAVHIKRLDHITKSLSIVVLSVYWFNPLVWLAFILSNKDRELACDESVMKLSNDDIRAEYANSLVTIGIHKGNQIGSLAFGESNIKSRVKSIVNFKKPQVWVVAIAIILIVAIGVVCLTNAVNNQSLENTDLQHEEYCNQIIENDGRYIVVNSGMTWDFTITESPSDINSNFKEIIGDWVDTTQYFNKTIYVKAYDTLLNGDERNVKYSPKTYMFIFIDNEPIFNKEYEPSDEFEHDKRLLIQIHETAHPRRKVPFIHHVQIKEYLDEIFTEEYTQFYDNLKFEISNYEEQSDDASLTATFFYNMKHTNYYKDPDTVDYIKQAKANGSPEYKALYDDYNAEHEGNYDFQLTARLLPNGNIDIKTIEVLGNGSPTGVEYNVPLEDYFVHRTATVKVLENNSNRFLDGVTMTPTQKVYPHGVKTITVIWKNDTDKNLTFGEPFAITVKDGERWRQITKPDANFHTIGYQLEAGQQREHTYDISDIAGELGKGAYRISVNYSEVFEPGKYDTYSLYCEFVVE